MSIARFIPGVVMVVTVTTFAPAAPVPKDDKAAKIAAELKQLSGTWDVESAVLGDRELPRRDPPNRYEFKGSLITVVATKGMWIMEVDPSANPKRMTQTEAELKDGKPVPKTGGNVNLCVYSLVGNKLTTVIARSGPNGKNLGLKGEFPKSLPPEPGDPVLVITHKRVKN
jgi:uncharacterized protein (TIGR03067 family)